MSGLGFPCWQCGRPSPGGVCLGPHEGYDHREAEVAGMVMNLDRQGIALTFAGSNGASVYSHSYYLEVIKPRRRQERFERKLRAEQRLAARIERTFAA